MTGLEWVRESGLLTTPVAITNTHSVGVVRDALVAVSVERADARTVHWSLPVVGETYDGLLNDINGFHVRGEHLRAALAAARGRTRRRGQRRRRDRDGLPRVQGRHRDGVAGHPRGPRRVHGRGAGPGELRQAGVAAGRWRAGRRGDRGRRGGEPVGRRFRRSRPRRRPGPGSIIVVVATDAPLLPAPVRASRPARGPRHRARRGHRRAHQRRPVHRVRDRQRLPPDDEDRPSGLVDDVRIRRRRDRSTRCSTASSRRPRRRSSTPWSPPRR